MALVLPLKIKRHSESIEVQDASGRSIYLYFEDLDLRRNEMKRWTSAEAEALAKRIARLLTDDAEKARTAPEDGAG